MLKTTEKRITIPPDQTDPMVYFRGTEKEIAAAENMRNCQMAVHSESAWIYSFEVRPGL